MYELFVTGLVIHLIADWLLQSHWIAINKTDIKNPAAWIHGGIHLVGLIFVYHPLIAILITLIHIFIDTRIPIKFLEKHIPGPPKGSPFEYSVFIWRDQVMHIVVLFLMSALQEGYHLC